MNLILGLAQSPRRTGGHGPKVRCDCTRWAEHGWHNTWAATSLYVPALVADLVAGTARRSGEVTWRSRSASCGSCHWRIVAGRAENAASPSVHLHRRCWSCSPLLLSRKCSPPGTVGIAAKNSQFRFACCPHCRRKCRTAVLMAEISVAGMERPLALLEV